MTDTWQNTWAWETEIAWREWESNWRERGLIRPFTETFVDPSPGEIAMPENTNNTQAAGRQIGWGAAAEPLPIETLETYAAADNPHMRSMARELLLHRRQRAADAPGAIEALAKTGHSSPDIPNGVAITQVANMLAELFQWRNGTRRLPGTQTMTLDGGKVVVWGGQADMSYLTGLLDELGEWRSGTRIHGTAMNLKKRRELEQLDGLREVLTGLGWTPPQS